MARNEQDLEPAAASSPNQASDDWEVVLVATAEESVASSFVELARLFGARVDPEGARAGLARWSGLDTVEPAVRMAAALHAETSSGGPPVAVGVVAVDEGDHPEGPSLARAVSRLASPGQTLVSPGSTVLPASVVCAAFGSLHPASFDDPVTVLRVVSIESGGPRPGFRTVGRTEEIEAFRRLSAQVVAQQSGAMVHLVGEAGIGKSHLLIELRRIAVSHGFSCHRTFDHYLGRRRSRSMMAMLVRSLLEVSGSSSDEPDDERLEAAMASLDNERHLPMVRSLLDLPPRVEDRRLFEAMAPDVREREQFEAFGALVRRRAEQGPLLVEVEDVHWSSPESRRGVEVVARCSRELPIIVVTTSRPTDDPFDEAWGRSVGLKTLRRVELSPLAADDARALAASIVSSRRSPWMLSSDQYLRDEKFGQCVARSGGNPLLLEQLLLDTRAQTSAAGPLSVSALIRARLFGLEPAPRRALQLAALLGEHFEAKVIDAAMNEEGWGASAAVAVDLIVPEGVDFRFSHALVRDAVDETLLEAERRAGHLRLAEVLEAPALRADHFERAGDPRASAAYLEAARREDRAVRYTAACAYVERGLACARSDEDRYGLQALMGRMHVDRGRADDALAAFEAALAVAPGPVERCRCLIGMVSAMRLLSWPEEAEAPLAEAEQLAEAYDLPELIGLAAYYRGCLLFSRGDVEPCLAQHQRAVHHARLSGHSRVEALALSGLGDAHYARSRVGSALVAIERCLEIARAEGYGRIEVANLQMSGGLRALENQLDAGLRMCREAVGMAVRVGNRRAEMIGLLNTGLCLVPMMQLDEGLEKIAQSKRIAQQMNAPVFVAMIGAFEAHAHAQNADPARARACALASLEVAKTAGAQFFGGIALGALARGASTGQERDDALRRGEALLASPCVSHNYIYFYQDAIEASIDAGRWDWVLRYAEALDRPVGRESTARCRLVAARARALEGLVRAPGSADCAETIRRVICDAEAVKQLALIPALRAALSRSGAG